MSGLVDMWTNEMSKLRQKEKEHVVQAGAVDMKTNAGSEENGSTGQVSGGASRQDGSRFLIERVRVPHLHCSDASVSMLVETFSP